MSYRRRRSSSAIPLLPWMELGWKASEMMMASAFVIGRRTGMMATSGAQPTARERREFTRMGQEKLDAAMESGMAMARQMMTTNQRLWIQAVEQMLAVTAAVIALAGSTTMAQSTARQRTLGRAVAKSVDTGSRLSDSAAKVARRGLDPVSTRATANARRLRR